MITNVSDIINNIFEKIFENPEISFSHPNRTFQYAVRHGKLNEDYLVLNEDTLERKLKTGIAQAIVKEFPACDPDVRVTVFYDDPHEKRVYNVKCSIAIYYSFTERADNIDGKTVVLSEEDGKKLLEETLKRMEVSPSTGNSAPSEESTDDVEENSETEETSSTVPEQKISHYDSYDLEFLAD